MTKTPVHRECPRRQPTRRHFLGLSVVATAGGVLPTVSSAVETPPLPDPLHRLPVSTNRKTSIILVSDEQLNDLQDPDREVDLSTSPTPRVTTLRKVCQQAKTQGVGTLVIAFDAFWEQYRPGQKGRPRTLTPDSDVYIERLRRISATIKAYGLGLELSLLTPLEIGTAYKEATGESGRWVQYREGCRDPRTGHYTVGMWQQTRWTNNKGTIELRRTGLRAFAFREQRLGQSAFYRVDPKSIVELRTSPELDLAEPESPHARRQRLVVQGRGDADAGPLDRVLVVASYETPEMDYFSDRAGDYLTNLVQRYRKAEIPLVGLYSDEPHIQQDTAYFSHHDEGQFTYRYLTKNLASRYAKEFGSEFADLEKYLVYFCYGQHGFYPDLEARLPAQHVLGASPDDVQRTFLLRRRYFDLLDRTVVGLFVGAKQQAEKLYGRKLDATAHATWAQSPTIDQWRTGETTRTGGAFKYEYTPNFLWSNTVQQASAACADYFRWGEFLTGGGTDHAEGGWSDRDYYGLALACSLGIVNPNDPYAYAAGWGWPAEVGARYAALRDAYGASASPIYRAIQERQHRDVEVLMLYPLSLVACEERFGSWMTQYGYANYLTPDKLVALGRIGDSGYIELAGRRFTTVVVLFEPLPPPGLLPMLDAFARRGGRVVWSGPAPRLSLDGKPTLAAWQQLCGVKQLNYGREGMISAGGVVQFIGPLVKVTSQTILTDFLVDQVYPVDPAEGVQVAATLAGRTIGLHRNLDKGSVTYLGFRPRDDQSASLGYESRTWFEVLRTLGAYPPSRAGLPVNDNPSVVSRASDFLATRFPNGSVAVAAHYRNHEEAWPGGFHRNPKADAEVISRHPLPSIELNLQGQWIAGHQIDYRGHLIMAFRADAAGHLIAFGGHACRAIGLNGRTTTFAERPLATIGWAPIPAADRVAGGAQMQIWAQGAGQVCIALPPGMVATRLVRQGPRPASPGEEVPVKIQNGNVSFELNQAWGMARLFVL